MQSGPSPFFFFTSPSTFSSLDLCFTIWHMNFYLVLLQSLMRQSKLECIKLSGPQVHSPPPGGLALWGQGQLQ